MQQELQCWCKSSGVTGPPQIIVNHPRGGKRFCKVAGETVVFWMRSQRTFFSLRKWYRVQQWKPTSRTDHLNSGTVGTANSTVWIPLWFYLSTYCTVVKLVTVAPVRLSVDMVISDLPYPDQQREIGKKPSTSIKQATKQLETCQLRMWQPLNVFTPKF